MMNSRMLYSIVACLSGVISVADGLPQPPIDQLQQPTNLLPQPPLKLAADDRLLEYDLHQYNIPMPQQAIDTTYAEDEDLVDYLMDDVRDRMQKIKDVPTHDAQIVYFLQYNLMNILGYLKCRAFTDIEIMPPKTTVTVGDHSDRDLEDDSCFYDTSYKAVTKSNLLHDYLEIMWRYDLLNHGKPVFTPESDDVGWDELYYPGHGYVNRLSEDKADEPDQYHEDNGSEVFSMSDEEYETDDFATDRRASILDSPRVRSSDRYSFTSSDTASGIPELGTSAQSDPNTLRFGDFPEGFDFHDLRTPPMPEYHQAAPESVSKAGSDQGVIDVEQDDRNEPQDAENEEARIPLTDEPPSGHFQSAIPKVPSTEIVEGNIAESVASTPDDGEEDPEPERAKSVAENDPDNSYSVTGVEGADIHLTDERLAQDIGQASISGPSTQYDSSLEPSSEMGTSTDGPNDVHDVTPPVGANQILSPETEGAAFSAGFPKVIRDSFTQNPSTRGFYETGTTHPLDFDFNPVVSRDDTFKVPRKAKKASAQVKALQAGVPTQDSELNVKLPVESTHGLENIVQDEGEDVKPEIPQFQKNPKKPTKKPTKKRVQQPVRSSSTKQSDITVPRSVPSIQKNIGGYMYSTVTTIANFVSKSSFDIWCRAKMMIQAQCDLFWSWMKRTSTVRTKPKPIEEHQISQEADETPAVSKTAIRKAENSLKAEIGNRKIEDSRKIVRSAATRVTEYLIAMPYQNNAHGIPVAQFMEARKHIKKEFDIFETQDLLKRVEDLKQDQAYERVKSVNPQSEVLKTVSDARVIGRIAQILMDVYGPALKAIEEKDDKILQHPNSFRNDRYLKKWALIDRKHLPPWIQPTEGIVETLGALKLLSSEIKWKGKAS